MTLLRCSKARFRTCTTALLAVAGLTGSGVARADEPSYSDLSQDIDGRPQPWWSVSGYFRSRGEALYNADLDRGLDPTGQPLYPVPPSLPASQLLTHADVRLRTDLTARTPRGGGSVHLRLDWLDGLGLGSAPDGAPTAATGQKPASTAAVLRHAYAMAALPFGALAVGRMSAHWGMGMVSHGAGDLDSDRGDAADRIALVSPLLGHIVAVSYDWSATGPAAQRPSGSRSIDLDPSDDVRSVTVAVLQWHTDQSRKRRLKADKTTLEYGVFVSRRWQDRDVPASWATATPPAELGSAQWVKRGLDVYAGDLWLKASGKWGAVEAEAFALTGAYQQASLIPGVQLREPIELRQLGAALRSEFGESLGFAAGLDAGAASGDPAPGVGAFAAGTATVGKPGTLRAAQVDPPRDTMLSEFRMSPEFRVDRILFRELWGAVADAVYLRPHLRYRWAEVGAGRLTLDLAAIQSFAVYAASAPGGRQPLGFEIDPTLEYQTRDGLTAALQYAVLLPQSGLDNPAAGLLAKPAQLGRVIVRWAF